MAPERQRAARHLGGTRWPDGPVYSVRTRHGDDLLMNPARTHLVLENDLRTFSPLLSERASVAPALFLISSSR